MLQSVRAAGFPLPAGDDGRLQVRRPLPDVDALLPVEPGVPLVAVHPGASAPARAYPWPLWATAVERLIADGWQVVLTGEPLRTAADQAHRRCRWPARRPAPFMISPAGSTWRSWRRCSTGPRSRWSPTPVRRTCPPRSGTPVVSLFAPVVPALRWAPFGVPVELLGDQDAPCRDTRWTACQLDGHPCLTSVSAEQIVERRAAAVRSPAGRPGS